LGFCPENLHEFCEELKQKIAVLARFLLTFFTDSVKISTTKIVVLARLSILFISIGVRIDEPNRHDAMPRLLDKGIVGASF